MSGFYAAHNSADVIACQISGPQITQITEDFVA